METTKVSSYISRRRAKDKSFDEAFAGESERLEVEIQKPEIIKSKRGRTRTIEIYKDGKLIKTIEGLLKTFEWARENKIANEGWVKNSLKTGEETAAGYKYKEGGYLFKYAD